MTSPGSRSWKMRTMVLSCGPMLHLYDGPGQPRRPALAGGLRRRPAGGRCGRTRGQYGEISPGVGHYGRLKDRCDAAAFPLFTLPWEVRLADITQSFLSSLFLTHREEYRAITAGRNFSSASRLVGPDGTGLDRMERRGAVYGPGSGRRRCRCVFFSR